MQLTVLVLFVVVTFATFLSKELDGAQLLKFLPELISVQIFVYVLVTGARSRFAGVPPKYWVAFVALLLIIVCGAVSNDVSSGPMVSALRFYVRAMPLFFLPAVCEFSELELQQQLKLLLLIALTQLPLAGYQRYVIWSHGRYSGDDVQGSLMDSGVLTIFLVSAALVATGFMLKSRLSKPRYLLLLLLLLLPTTINETKVTGIFVPLGLMVVFVVGAQRGKRLRVIAVSSALIVLFGAIFLPVYNYFQAGDPYKKQDDFTSVFTNQRNLDKYLDSDVTTVGTKGDVRRGDALRVPLEYLSTDPIRLALGLGIGSVSPSTLGAGFEGRYYRLFDRFLIMSFSYFVLEIGIFGVGVVLLIYWFIFQDALFLARYDAGLVGSVAIGWVGVTLLMCASLVYSSIHMFESLSYLFWYFSGLMAARRLALARQPELAPAATPGAVVMAGRQRGAV